MCTLCQKDTLAEFNVRVRRLKAWKTRAECVTQMTTSARALHSRNGWGFAAGGDGDSLPDNFLAVPR